MTCLTVLVSLRLRLAALLVGWCELRQAFRHFRTDRIDALAVLAQRYPSSHPALLQAWKTQQGIIPDK